jgi:hypothetical protein
VTTRWAAEVFSFDPITSQFTGCALANCNADSHSGLNVDASNGVWWDEQFDSGDAYVSPAVLSVHHLRQRRRCLRILPV